MITRIWFETARSQHRGGIGSVSIQHDGGTTEEFDGISQDEFYEWASGGFKDSLLPAGLPDCQMDVSLDIPLEPEIVEVTTTRYQRSRKREQKMLEELDTELYGTEGEHEGEPIEEEIEQQEAWAAAYEQRTGRKPVRYPDGTPVLLGEFEIE